MRQATAKRRLLGEWEQGGDASLTAIAERIAARRPMRVSAMEFEEEKPTRRWSRCFKSVDIERVRKAYQENATAAGANSVDRCSCIVMLNVALGQLLKLKTKESRARSTSTRKVQMGALTTETIEKAMAQLRRSGYANPAITINFFDRRNKTAGTLEPERLKREHAEGSARWVDSERLLVCLWDVDHGRLSQRAASSRQDRQ